MCLSRSRRAQRTALIISLVVTLIVGVISPVLGVALPGYPYRRPGHTSLVSLGPGDQQITEHAADPDVTPDGRFVTFFSRAADAVEGDTNGWGDVFVRDVQAGETTRASVASDGTEANQDSFQGEISDDGRYVAFVSYATNLTTEIEKDWRFADVFLRDLGTGETTIVTRGIDGAPANGGSLGTTMSGDGRFVAFFSHASNLVPDDANGRGDVFVYDRTTEEIERVSMTYEGLESDGTSAYPRMTPDGRYVAFYSQATNLVPGDDNASPDVFLVDRVEDTIEVVSVNSNEEIGNDHSASIGLALTPDARYVAFQSRASNLVPLDSNGATNILDAYDVFVRDRVEGTTERVSIGPAGEQRVSSNGPSITDDGRYVAFYSRRPGEDSGDWTAPEDVWVHDRETGSTELISGALNGRDADLGSENPSITADGETVFFSSAATNLVRGDYNDTIDIMSRHRGTDPGVVDLVIERVGSGFEATGGATYSGIVLDDVIDPQDSTSNEIGTELTGARVSYRPEHADLLVRIDVDGMLSVPTYAAGSPVHVYGLAFTLDGVPYEARAAAPGASERTADPAFALYRCELNCARVAGLAGGYGTAGDDVRFSIPLAPVGGVDGLEIKSLEAFVGVGQLPTGTPTPVDSVALKDIAVPEPVVEVAVAPAGAEPGDFERVNMHQGRFTASVTSTSLPDGPARLWTRACLDDLCGLDSVALPWDEPSPDPTSSGSPTPTQPSILATVLELTDETSESVQYSDRAVLSARLTDAAGSAISGADVSFLMSGEDGNRIFSTATDGDGVATIPVTVMERPGVVQLSARFDGSDAHAPSADTSFLTVDREDSITSIAIDGKGSQRTFRARLVDADSGDPIPGRNIDFSSEGAVFATSATGPDGWAQAASQPKKKGARQRYDAAFAGDDYYLGSTDSATP